MNLFTMLKLYGPVKSDAGQASGGGDAGQDQGQEGADAGVYGAEGGADDSAADGGEGDDVTSLDDATDEGDEHGGDDSDDSSDDADDADSGDEGVVTKPVKGKKSATQTLRIDPRDLAALRQQQDQGQGQDQQQERMTPEQVKKLLNPVTVTPDYLKQLGFEEPTEGQVKGFQTFANDVVKNAVSVARLMIQREADKFQTALQPLHQAHQSQQVEQAKQQFYGAYPQLQKYGTVVQQVANEIRATNPQGSNKEIFRAVAVETVKRLNGMGLTNVSLKANPGAGQQQGGTQQPRQNVVPRPNLGAGPGRSQNGGQSGGSSNNPDRAIYD